MIVLFFFPKLVRYSMFFTLPFKSKLTLDSRSSRELSREARLDSRLLRLDSRFLQDWSNWNGPCLQTIIKGFSLYSRYLIAARIYNLCSRFEQSSNFSHVKKISLLYKIANSTQCLILARNC